MIDDSIVKRRRRIEIENIKFRLGFFLFKQKKYVVLDYSNRRSFENKIKKW